MQDGLPARLLVFHLVLVASATLAQPAPIRNLFVVAGPSARAVESLGNDSPILPISHMGTVLRQRLVRANPDILRAARVGAGDAGLQPPVLRINPFEDVVFPVVIDHSGPAAAGYELWGRIRGQPLSSFTLVVNDGMIAGTLRTLSGTFTIRTVDQREGLLVIREVSPPTNLPNPDDVMPSPTAGPRESQRPARLQPIAAPANSDLPAPLAADTAGGPEDGSRIDVLVVYTPAAKRASGGRRQIETEIDLAIAETNQAYADSGVVQRLNLVLAREVDYVESDRHSDLLRLADWTDRHLNEVHGIRDRYAADSVVLLVGPDAFCCIAFVAAGDDDGDRADQAFAVARPTGYYFAHELGHVFGLLHDRYTARFVDERRLRDLVPPFRVGYVNQRMFEPDAPIRSRWWTIMAYDDQCVDWAEKQRHDRFWCFASMGKVMRYSNPRLSHNGDPTGVPGDRRSAQIAGPADARRMLNRTRRAAANFRRSPCLRDGARIRLQANSGQYLVAVGNGGGTVVANQPRPGPRVRLTLVDANGGCVEPGDVVSLRTSDGFYLRVRRGGGSTVDATAPRATPWARFKARRFRGKGALRNGDSVTLQTRSGHYVWAVQGGGGAVRADRRSPGAWGRFKIRRVR